MVFCFIRFKAKVVAFMVTVSLFVTATAMTNADTPQTAKDCKAAAQHVYALKGWQSKPDTSLLDSCNVPTRTLKKKFYEYKKYREVAPYRSGIGGGPKSPADHRYYAIPWNIVCGESGGNFYVNDDGAYQIIPSTWIAFGGGRFSSVAGDATPLEQHIIADNAWGKTPWYGNCN